MYSLSPEPEVRYTDRHKSVLLDVRRCVEQCQSRPSVGVRLRPQLRARFELRTAYMATNACSALQATGGIC